MTESWLRRVGLAENHGPLVALLLGMTVLTGAIDAVSLTGLGRVFVANMTGNVVFAALALGGAPGFSLAGSVVALVFFLVGAALGGVLVKRFERRRDRMLCVALTGVAALVAVASLVMWAMGASPTATTSAVGLLSIALGVQNASARAVAVPDMTTTVLTMTLTGIGADLRHHDYFAFTRRFAAVTAMFVGAYAAWVSLIAVGIAGVLGAISVMYLLFAGVLLVLGRRDDDWRIPVAPHDSR